MSKWVNVKSLPLTSLAGINYFHTVTFYGVVSHKASHTLKQCLIYRDSHSEF